MLALELIFKGSIMDNQIYYYIEHNCGLHELHTIVETSFGGHAHNYVKSDPFPSELQKYADSQGWKKWEGPLK